MLADEGFIDDIDDNENIPSLDQLSLFEGRLSMNQLSLESREDLIYKLIASLPRSQIARVHRRITPLVQVDIVGNLPDELALHVLSCLPWPTLLRCALVSRRWRTLADDNALWKDLCAQREWAWKWPRGGIEVLRMLFPEEDTENDGSDEGMSEEYESDQDTVNEYSQEQTLTYPRDQRTYGLPATPRISQPRRVASPPRRSQSPSPSTLVACHDAEIVAYHRVRNSAPSILHSVKMLKADYKLLHQTHILMRNRLAHGSYRFYTLQNRDTPYGHSHIIYCVQLFTYDDGRQVLFSGSRDLTVREWNLTTGNVDRIFHGAGRDLNVCLWDLTTGDAVSLMRDHADSVLCVRFDSKRLVSCSKDRTIRMYRFKQNRQGSDPIFEDGVILGTHRGAVNAIALSGDHVISVSGDKSLCIWDANTCTLVRKFDYHHTRGIATVAASGSWVVTGSSDMHIRSINFDTLSGWGTSEAYNSGPVLDNETRDGHCAVCICERCGTIARHADAHRLGHDSDIPPRHGDLVRTVGVNSNFVVSGSYDKSVKVWDRDRGNLIADLGVRHEGRIFCVDFNSTKIVSCGEDRMICVWDLAYGIETSFIHS